MAETMHQRSVYREPNYSNQEQFHSQYTANLLLDKMSINVKIKSLNQKLKSNYFNIYPLRQRGIDILRSVPAHTFGLSSLRSPDWFCSKYIVTVNYFQMFVRSNFYIYFCEFANFYDTPNDWLPFLINQMNRSIYFIFKVYEQLMCCKSVY